MQSVTLYYPGTSFFHLCDCRVKLLLIERFPIAYRGCIRLLQLLGRT